MGYRKKLNLRAGISCNSGWDLRSTWAVRYVYNSEVNSVKNVGFKTRQGIRNGERWHQSLREWVTTPQGRWKRQKTHQGGESCGQHAGADEDSGAAFVFLQSVALLIALLSSSWVMWTCDETETNYTSNVCMTDAGHTSGHKKLSAPRSAWQHCSVFRQEAVSDSKITVKSCWSRFAARIQTTGLHFVRGHICREDKLCMKLWMDQSQICSLPLLLTRNIHSSPSWSLCTRWVTRESKTEAHASFLSLSVSVCVKYYFMYMHTLQKL